MDSKTMVDAIREAERLVSGVAATSRQTVNNDAAPEVAVARSARAEHPTTIPAAPVGGPEYSGRA